MSRGNGFLPQGLLLYLLIAQVVISLGVFYGVYRVFQALVFETDKSTPSCPDGLPMILPDELARQCNFERVTLYTPTWAITTVRVGVPLVVACLLAASALSILTVTPPHIRGVQRITLHGLAFLIALALQVLLIPIHLLIRLVAFGVEGLFF